jgi:hypothetical protein
MLHGTGSEGPQLKPPPPSTVRKNALGYGSASFHPDLSRPHRGHSLEAGCSAASTSINKDDGTTHADAYAPPPPLILVAAEPPLEAYSSRRGPRVRFADEFHRVTPLAVSTPEISPVDQSLSVPIYLPKPQPVEVLEQISRGERQRRHQQRISPSRRSLSSEATTGVSSQSSSRTASPFERQIAGRRDSPSSSSSAPYCRTDLETVKLPVWGFRSCSTDSNPAGRLESECANNNSVSGDRLNDHHELHSTKVLRAHPKKRCVLSDEPFTLRTEQRGQIRSSLVAKPATEVPPRTRVASRSPIRVSPNRYASELRSCLSKSPTRVPFSGATVVAQTTAVPLTFRKPSSASSTNGTTSRLPSAVSSSAPTPRASTSQLRSALLQASNEIAARKPPPSLPLPYRNQANDARPTVPQKRECVSEYDEPTLRPSESEGRPAPACVKAPSMRDVMETYRQKLDDLKHMHDRNLLRIQQQQKRAPALKKP